MRLDGHYRADPDYGSLHYLDWSLDEVRRETLTLQTARSIFRKIGSGPADVAHGE